MVKKQRSLSAIDKKIINRLQRDIPFVKKPWSAIARELEIDEARLLKRIGLLKKIGVIRRISATFNPQKVGFTSTLVAAKVASRDIDKVAKRINAYEEITHNYKRDSEYNLWFTLVARSKNRISQVLREIKRDNKEIKKLVNLPAKRLFKIGVKFKV